MEYGAPSALPVGGITDFHHDFWAVSGTLDVGANGQIFMYYGWAGDGKGDNVLPGYRVFNGTTSSVAAGSDTGAQDWEISYSYIMSKRTVLYTGYHKIDNDNRAQYNFNINSVNNLAIGGKPGGFVAGMYHSF